MIQDIAPHTYHNEYRPVAPDGSSFVLAYENGKSFFHKNDTDNSITLPRFRELEGNVSDLYKNYIYLFSIDDERFYLTESFVMYSHSILLLLRLPDISSGSGTETAVSADAAGSQ